MAPFVDGFYKESDILLNLTRYMAANERTGITKRGYIAKELAANLYSEIFNKLRMFKRIKKQKSTYSYGSLNKIRFMHSRLKEMALSLERAQANINVALESYA